MVYYNLSKIRWRNVSKEQKKKREPQAFLNSDQKKKTKNIWYNTLIEHHWLIYRICDALTWDLRQLFKLQKSLQIPFPSRVKPGRSVKFVLSSQLQEVSKANTKTPWWRQLQPQYYQLTVVCSDPLRSQRWSFQIPGLVVLISINSFS